MEQFAEEDPEDVFKILLATDTHLGYAENDPIRGEDSFNAFEEVLQIAVRENVDFIVHGGDLFHEAKPSPSCLQRCVNLLREHCFGDKPVQVEFLSDPSESFSHCKNQRVNYDDPNLNVSIPIFAIHGNHDDPTGKDNISALDTLASMGLLNYIGRHDDLSRLEIKPIVLQKGASTLAIYGLSHIRDVRLARLFHDNKVTINTYSAESEDLFHFLILHQNRANRGVKNYIPDTFIPDFLDLVMWGHEHDSYVQPVYAANGKTLITQPGSSVATSLSEGESCPKSIGLLRVFKNKFHIEPIPLTTVRPFIFKQISLEPIGSTGGTHIAKKTMKEVEQVVKTLIAEAKKRRGDMLPLIRVVVKYTDERQVFNCIRFGQNFGGQIANVEDLIKFNSIQQKERVARKKRVAAGGTADEDDEEMQNAQTLEDVLALKLEEEQYKMQLFSRQALLEGVKKFVESNNDEAPFLFMEHQMKLTLDQLKKDLPGEDEIDAYLENLRMQRESTEIDYEEVLNSSKASSTQFGEEMITISGSDEEGVVAAAPSTSRGGRGRGSRARGSRARGKKST